MKLTLTPLLLVAAAMPCRAADLPRYFDAFQPTVNVIASAAEELPAERRKVLDQAAEYITRKLQKGEKARLTFICTHNSRRSHLAQIWAQVAADYYGLAGVETYSGGTEATACNIRTVRALRRAGLEIVSTTDDENPRYLVQYAKNRLPLLVFSKVYDASPNPVSDYAAMMCCADADERCPIVHGTEARISLHYFDPKAADNTPDEAATYDERSRQIGTEMFYVAARSAELLGRK